MNITETAMWLAWYRESLAPDNHDALRLKEAKLPKITGSSPQLHKRRFAKFIFKIVLFLSHFGDVEMTYWSLFTLH